MSTQHLRHRTRKGDVAACVAVIAGLAAAAGFMAWGGDRGADESVVACRQPAPSLPTAL